MRRMRRGQICLYSHISRKTVCFFVVVFAIGDIAIEVKQQDGVCLVGPWVVHALEAQSSRCPGASDTGSFWNAGEPNLHRFKFTVNSSHGSDRVCWRPAAGSRRQHEFLSGSRVRQPCVPNPNPRSPGASPATALGHGVPGHAPGPAASSLCGATKAAPQCPWLLHFQPSSLLMRLGSEEESDLRPECQAPGLGLPSAAQRCCLGNEEVSRPLSLSPFSVTLLFKQIHLEGSTHTPLVLKASFLGGYCILILDYQHHKEQDQ